MVLLKTLAQIAFQRWKSDPELQEKVKDTIKHEVLPRAKQKWTYVKPEIKKAAHKGKAFVKEIRKSLDK